MSRSRFVLSTVSLLAVASVALTACGSSDRSAAGPSSQPSGSSSGASPEALVEESPAAVALDAPAALSAAIAPVPPRVRWQSLAHGIKLWLRTGQNSGPVTAFEAVLAKGMGEAPVEGAQVTTCWPTAAQPEAECILGARPGQYEVWVRAVNGASDSPWLVVTAKADPGKCTSVDVARGYCVIGDTGPGGGYVFYDAGSRQSWGRYLEAAPAGWSGSAEDPTQVWCPKSSKAYYYTRPTEQGFGAGAGNTRMIIGDCGFDTAAGLAASYGIAKNDWYLPSPDELERLLSYRTQVGITADPDKYWTSCQHSRVSNDNGYKQENVYVDDNYAYVGGSDRVSKKETSWFVRPIRAF